MSRREIWVNRVIGPQLFSPSVVTFAIIWSAISHFAGGSSGLTGNVLVRCLLASFTTAVFVIPAMYLDRPIVQRYPQLNAPALRSLILATALGMRGVLFETFLIDFGFTQNANYVFRGIASITGVGIATLGFSYLNSLLKSRREHITSLASTNAQLAEAISVLGAKVASGKDETADRIENILHEEIAQMTQGGQPASTRLLQDLLGQVVRPMSHQLASEIYSWAPRDVVRASTVRVKWYELWRHVRPENIYRPAVVTPAMILVSSPSFFIFQTITVLQIIAVIGCLIPLAILALRHFSAKVMNQLSDGIRALVMTIGLIACSIPTLLASALILRNSSDMLFVVRAGIFHLPLSAWILALANVAEINFRKLSDDLDVTNYRLRWTVARINLVTWYQRGEASRLLHGPVQTAIQASLFRLRDKVETGKGLAEHTAKEIEKLRSVVANLGEQRLPNNSLDAEFTDIIDAWQGIANISITCPAEISALLERDLPCATFVIDVVGEGSVNAIRHGRAKQVDIALNLKDDALIISCIDDGCGVDENQYQPGLGSRLLDKCALKWSRVRSGERTVLTVYLPILV